MSKPFGYISKILGKHAAESKTIRKPEPAPTYEITPEIRDILDAVETSQGKVIFVTGAAGTGKSTLINIVKSETRKQLAGSLDSASERVCGESHRG